jgi:hypothetical protein
MNYEIIYLSEVYEDVKENFEWYKSINPILAKRFKTTIKSFLIKIKQNPFVFEEKYNETRIAYIIDFPFGIHYKIENENTILIKAIFHTSRNPNLWKNRK